MVENTTRVQKNFTGEITFIKKTGPDIKLLVGNCMICDREKCMIVSDNTMEAESISDFFKNLGKNELDVSKKMARNVFKNPGRALKSEQTLVPHSLLEVLKQFYHHYLKWVISSTR